MAGTDQNWTKLQSAQNRLRWHSARVTLLKLDRGAP